MNQNAKPGALSYTGLFVVAGVVEISNFDLVKNLAEVVEYVKAINR
jgi:hypothetical protein